jgi:hypothetical protein
MKINLSNKYYDALVNASVFVAIGSAILYDHVSEFGGLFLSIGLLAGCVATGSYFVLHLSQNVSVELAVAKAEADRLREALKSERKEAIHQSAKEIK